MFVKNFLKLITAMYRGTNIHNVQDLFLATQDYLKNNPKLVNAENNFEQLIKQQICDAFISYYPELEPKERTLREALE
jgi:hypothetical protein